MALLAELLWELVSWSALALALAPVLALALVEVRFPPAPVRPPVASFLAAVAEGEEATAVGEVVEEVEQAEELAEGEEEAREEAAEEEAEAALHVAPSRRVQVSDWKLRLIECLFQEWRRGNVIPACR